MLGIILQILKIIGILLLFLFVLVLFVITAVLFVPVRYRLGASAHPPSASFAPKTMSGALLQDDIKIEACVSWLLHFVHVSFYMRKEGGKGGEEGTAGFDAQELTEHMSCRLRIFGIPVIDFLHPKPKKEKKKKRKKKQPEEGEASEPKSLSTLEQEAEENRAVQEAEERRSVQETGETEKKQSKPEQFMGTLKKLFEKVRHIKYTVIGFVDRLKEIAHKAQYYKDMLTGEETRTAREKAVFQLKRIGRHLKPSVFRTELSVGTPDPAVMGDILAVFGLFIPVLGNTVTITPYFDRYAAELELRMKGRMSVHVFLAVLWKLRFDADINRAWDLLKNPGL